MKSFHNEFVGSDIQVPLLDGSRRRYINLDNAASTPPLKCVREAVNGFMEYYSSVHRGTGFKSLLSTHYYEQSRSRVLEFVGADPAEHVCIFGKNTTEASNKLARRFPFTKERDTVILSTMEHHSNDLPWRAVANVVHVGLKPDGCLDEEDFDRCLHNHRHRVALVAITGASNVTGYINPIHRLAAKAHAAGARIAVDCAQLAPHRRIQMLPLDDPSHLDYVFISAHKMYAPLGTGALIGRRDTFASGDPDLLGGGEVEIVTLDRVEWSAPPDRDEAGSPNVIGAVALAAAITFLQSIGMDEVATHEAHLTRHALQRLSEVPGIHIYGSTDPLHAADRLGVIPLNLEGLSHYLLAAILGYEFGIGVRNGCFCAHPYLLSLMHVDEQQAEQVRTSILANDRSQVPGMVRCSFALYNDTSDVDAFIEALKAIAAGRYKGRYTQKRFSGQFFPDGWQVNFEDYFRFN